MSMAGIVRLSFLLAEAPAELAGREALAVLVEPEALEVSAAPEASAALEVSAELVATGGSTTLRIAAGLRTEIALLRTALAGRLAETR